MRNLSEDIFILEIPIFEPKYEEDKNYCYSNDDGKSNLKELLLKTSQGYCMYCYCKIIIDRKLSAHLEHSIEKENSDILKDCNINISITCPKCNLSFKKIGQKQRKLSDDEISVFEKNCSCKATCKEPCKSYSDIKDIYLKKENAEIILQPFGVVNRTTDNRYMIQYNLLEQKFIVCENISYNSEEISFIEKHINRFNLNDPEYRTREVYKVCEDVIYYKQIPRRNRYDNLMADLFIDKLNSLELEQAIALCNQIVILSTINHKN